MFSKKSEKYNIIDLFKNDDDIADFKFHYEENDIILCIRLAKQRAVHSLMRFSVIKCNCCINGKHHDSTVYFEENDATVLFTCGCDIDKYDVLEDILNNKDNNES